jgi:hypothetical protein
MTSSLKGHLFFHIIPAVLLRDVILCEMLDFKDIASLEVAAANKSIQDAKVSLVVMITIIHVNDSDLD